MRLLIVSIIYLFTLIAIGIAAPRLEGYAAYQCEAQGHLCRFVPFQDGPRVVGDAEARSSFWMSTGVGAGFQTELPKKSPALPPSAGKIGARERVRVALMDYGKGARGEY